MAGAYDSDDLEIAVRKNDRRTKKEMTESVFECGGSYRNRNGEYEVLELDGNRMVIRYVESGDSFNGDRVILERIWMNICREEREETEKSAPKPRKGTRRQGTGRGLSKGRSFQGLCAGDFQEGTAGTSWRRRESLGGLLARHLTDRSSAYFESYPVPRQPMANIARPGHYGEKIKWREAKFFIKLDTEQVSYGLYIERGVELQDDAWHWPRFLRSLRQSEALRAEVEGAMARLDLHWEWYVWKGEGLVARVFREEGGWSWVDANGGGTESISWDEFLGRLEGADETKRCELYLCRDMPKEEAMSLGVHLVEPVTDVFVGLLPLYTAAIGEEK